MNNKRLIPAVGGVAWIAVSLVPLVLLPWSHSYAVASNGSAVFLWVIGAVMKIAALLAMLVIPVLGALLFVQRWRTWRVAVGLIALIVFVPSVFFGNIHGQEIRLAAFQDLALRSRPLVDAIKAYERQYNAPPANLQALVPRFLPSVPGTGMRAYPEYQYYTGSPSMQHGNAWLLLVPAPEGGIEFDQLIYLPQQNYTQADMGGVSRLLIDWAYVNE